VWLLVSLTVLAIFPVGAQITGQQSPDAAQEAVEAASDAQRVRRIREVIEFDRARLEQARADQPQRQALFDQLAEVIAAWKADQQEKRLRLEQTSDPEKRESLEREIAKLDDELDLLRAQSELAFSSLTNQEITVGLARTALSGVLSAAPEGRPSINTQRIVSAVAREWEVTPEALASKRRTHSITVPRQVAMYLIKTLLDLPLVQIGDTFGGRDHSTVIHSIRKVEEEMAGNPDFHARVSAVRSQVVRGV